MLEYTVLETSVDIMLLFRQCQYTIREHTAELLVGQCERTEESNSSMMRGIIFLITSQIAEYIKI